MSLKPNSIAAAVALSLSMAAANAADLGDMFAVRGYSTAGAVYSDEDQADYITSTLIQPKGAGYSDEISYELDSRLAVQIDAKFSEKLSAVVQIMSENINNNSWDGDANKPYNPSLEWANISYKVTDDFTVRAGRVVMPFLMVSEYRKVGYANHWLRAPVEVYGHLPFSTSDGVDATYRSHVGNATNTLRVNYGYNSLRTDLLKSQARSYGINDTYELNALTVRVAYMAMQFESPGPGFASLVNPFVAAVSSLPPFMGADAAAAARRMEAAYNPSNLQKLKMYDVGVTYDPGNWLLMAEMMHQRSHGLLGETTGGYVSAGWRVKAFTPYATFSKVHKAERNEAGIPLAGLPPPLAAFGGVINGILVPLATDPFSQQTISLGSRWDAMKNVSIKAQYDYIDLAKGSKGMLTNLQPGFVPGGDLNVVSVAVDFVF